MRIVQILDNPGLDRTAFTVAVAECTYSAAISINFVTIWRPPSRFADGNPSQSPFQCPNSRFRPVYQTGLPPYLVQNTFESDVGMAVVPVFNYPSSIPVSVVPATETYANNPARGRYFNCSVNPHGSVYPYALRSRTSLHIPSTRWRRLSNIFPISVGRCHAALHLLRCRSGVG